MQIMDTCLDIHLWFLKSWCFEQGAVVPHTLKSVLTAALSAKHYTKCALTRN